MIAVALGVLGFSLFGLLVGRKWHSKHRTLCEDSLESIDPAQPTKIWKVFREIAARGGEEAAECYRLALASGRVSGVVLGAVGLRLEGADDAPERISRAVLNLAISNVSVAKAVREQYAKTQRDWRVSDAIARHDPTVESREVLFLEELDSLLERIPPVFRRSSQLRKRGEYESAVRKAVEEFGKEAFCEAALEWAGLATVSFEGKPWYTERPGFRSATVISRWFGAFLDGDDLRGRKDGNGRYCKEDDDCGYYYRCVQVCSGDQGLCVFGGR